MKKLILGTVLVFLTSLAFTQTTDDYIEILRSVLKTEKKAAIAEVMQLNEQEGEVFWPLYNEFNEKMYTVQSKRVKIIKDFAANYESMTDLKADELWKSSMNFKQEALTLTKQYYKKFKKILPAGKAAKYFQAENKIATLIDYQLAIEIPMIETE
jgi:hypothetical protein